MLDEIVPGRVKTVEEWMRKTAYTREPASSVLKDYSDARAEASSDRQSTIIPSTVKLWASSLKKGQVSASWLIGSLRLQCKGLLFVYNSKVIWFLILQEVDNLKAMIRFSVERKCARRIS